MTSRSVYTHVMPVLPFTDTSRPDQPKRTSALLNGKKLFINPALPDGKTFKEELLSRSRFLEDDNFLKMFQIQVYETAMRVWPMVGWPKFWEYQRGSRPLLDCESWEHGCWIRGIEVTSLHINWGGQYFVMRWSTALMFAAYVWGVDHWKLFALGLLEWSHLCGVDECENPSDGILESHEHKSSRIGCYQKAVSELNNKDVCERHQSSLACILTSIQGIAFRRRWSRLLSAEVWSLVDWYRIRDNTVPTTTETQPGTVKVEGWRDPNDSSFFSVRPYANIKTSEETRIINFEDRKFAGDCNNKTELDEDPNEESANVTTDTGPQQGPVTTPEQHPQRIKTSTTLKSTSSVPTASRSKDKQHSTQSWVADQVSRRNPRGQTGQTTRRLPMRLAIPYSFEASQDDLLGVPDIESPPGPSPFSFHVTPPTQNRSKIPVRSKAAQLSPTPTRQQTSKVSGPRKSLNNAPSGSKEVPVDRNEVHSEGEPMRFTSSPMPVSPAHKKHKVSKPAEVPLVPSRKQPSEFSGTKDSKNAPSGSKKGRTKRVPLRRSEVQAMRGTGQPLRSSSPASPANKKDNDK